MDSKDAAEVKVRPRKAHTPKHNEHPSHRISTKVENPLVSKSEEGPPPEISSPKVPVINPNIPEKRNFQKCREITPEMRALGLIPLKDGWTREIRLRLTVSDKNIGADVYYFAPDGKKFRSRCEISEYLNKNSITKYDLSNFLFYPRTPLGGDYAHYEVVRKCSFHRSVHHKSSNSTVGHNILMTSPPTEGLKEDKKSELAKPPKKRKPRNPLEPIKHHNPDDKLYCICTDIEWGQMVTCANVLCAIKLYHLDCVVLREVPKELWYCPICRGSDSRTLNPTYASNDGSSKM